MPRLIDADALKARVHEVVCGHKPPCIPKGECEHIINMFLIDDAPTIDPVKHGRWIKSTTKNLEVECICSVCSGDAPSEYGRYAWIKSDYCPSCGCKMEGGRDA